MSAVVIDFSSALAQRRAARPAAVEPRTGAHGTLSHDFTFWRGVTGARYVHTIYPLLECPELPNANVILVRRHDSGRSEVMQICRLENETPSLNLAEIRRSAVTLGANEIHVHLLAGSAADREGIERDLSGAGELAVSGSH